MRAVFVDGDAASGRIFERLAQQGDPSVRIHLDPDVDPKTIPDVLAGAEIAIIDHSYLPTDVAKRCAGLKHVVFLGTGARSYMNPEELGEAGIAVHTIKGYGDTAVAECAMALMWESARGIARMDREMRKGAWLRTESMQLTGKTLGLIGFGGIGAEVARMASGIGMRVIAWNRTPKSNRKRDLRRHRHAPEGEPRRLDASAPERRDARLPVARTHCGDEEGRHPGQHRPRRAGG